MGIDTFLDTSSLVDEHCCGNSKTFDGGRGECLQEVCDENSLGGAEVVQYLELLDEWQDGRRWGDGGLAFISWNRDLLKHVHTRAGGPPLRYQGTRVQYPISDATVGVWETVVVLVVGFAEFVNHLVEEL